MKKYISMIYVDTNFSNSIRFFFLMDHARPTRTYKKKRHFSNENPNSSKGQVEGGLHLKTWNGSSMVET